MEEKQRKWKSKLAQVRGQTGSTIWHVLLHARASDYWCVNWPE